jgi:hypothetical protein
MGNTEAARLPEPIFFKGDSRGHRPVCGVTPRFLPVALFPFFRFFAFAHRTFAAFRAISCRSFLVNFCSLALTDLRPSAEKYSDSFLSITALL